MPIAFRAAGTVVTGDNLATFTLTAPAGTVSTDIVLAVHVFETGGSLTTIPAGWTLVKSINDATSGHLEVYRGLGSATFGDWGPNNCGAQAGFTLGYTGVDNTTPMDAAGVGQANASSTTATATSITTVTNNAWLVGCFGTKDTTRGTVPTWSAEFGTHRQNGGVVGALTTVAVDAADAVQASAGASGTKTATLSKSLPNIGILVALRPADGGGGSSATGGRPVSGRPSMPPSGPFAKAAWQRTRLVATEGPKPIMPEAIALPSEQRKIRPGTGPFLKAWLARAKLLATDSIASALNALSPSEASITVSGVAATLLLALAPTSATITVSGNAPRIVQILAPSEASITVSGNAPGITQALAPATAQVVVTGAAPALTQTLGASSGQVIVAGAAPTLAQTLAPTEGQAIVGGNAPTLSQALTIQPAEGAVVLAGATPDLLTILTPTEGAIALSGNAPAVSLAIVPPSDGQVVLLGNAPDVSIALQSAEVDLGTARRPFGLGRPIYRHPEELEREQRMLAEYLRELEKTDKHLARAPTSEPNKAERAIPVPRLTDAMARAASAEHLMAIARSATAAVLDRQKAAEEQRRRGLTAILLLALD